jgi:hypothetical protein
MMLMRMLMLLVEVMMVGFVMMLLRLAMMGQSVLVVLGRPREAAEPPGRLARMNFGLFRDSVCKKKNFVSVKIKFLTLLRRRSARSRIILVEPEMEPLQFFARSWSRIEMILLCKTVL